MPRSAQEYRDIRHLATPARPSREVDTTKSDDTNWTMVLDVWRIQQPSDETRTAREVIVARYAALGQLAEADAIADQIDADPLGLEAPRV